MSNRALILVLAGILVTKSCKFNSIRGRKPLEVEHRVNRLDLNPPAALLKSQSDDIRVISIANDELVAVLNIGVFKWNLANGTLEDICVSTLALLEALLSRFLV